MARQKLGQHFLSNPSILQRIADAACAAGEPLVIEIGPGKGALTKYLLHRAQRVVAIELDAGLASALRAAYAAEPRLEIIQADALQTDLTQWGPAVLTGNLPYYAATPILEGAARLGPTIRQSVFLIQKEVAERAVAAPGTKAYGYLTVLLAIHADSQILFDVKPGAFRPPPKVDSSVIRLNWHPKLSELGIEDPRQFLNFVSTCFRHKRKTIRNNLASPHLPPHELLARRAEQLTLADFAALYRQVYDSAGGKS
jgi:16S rRNA (adenine1518-N6/adenine1519-N6)-dimethyltransferase